MDSRVINVEHGDIHAYLYLSAILVSATALRVAKLDH